MEALDFLSDFRLREGEDDISKATWYIAAATGLAAANQSAHIPKLYELATHGLSLADRKMVQRRLKEALLKGTVLYGVPRAAQALGPLYRAVPDDEVDLYSPRTEKFALEGEAAKRVERGRKYFDITWTPGPAQEVRDRSFKNHPDCYLLNLETIYQLWISEDAILSNLETQMCTTTLLTCLDSPIQALWHTRGLIRHGASLEQARFAQELGLAIAEQFGCKTAGITMVDDIVLDETYT